MLRRLLLRVLERRNIVGLIEFMQIELAVEVVATLFIEDLRFHDVHELRGAQEFRNDVHAIGFKESILRIRVAPHDRCFRFSDRLHEQFVQFRFFCLQAHVLLQTPLRFRELLSHCIDFQLLGLHETRRPIDDRLLHVGG